MSEWAQQLAGLMSLGFCTAMAMPRSRPQIASPSVEHDKPAKPKPRKKNNPSPEVQEFMSLPPHIQRQVLDYARNWIDAHFEKVN